MDTWGIVIFTTDLALYFLSKKQPIFLFLSGVGAGMFVTVLVVTAILWDLF
jgi:hypothetical protein